LSIVRHWSLSFWLLRQSSLSSFWVIGFVRSVLRLRFRLSLGPFHWSGLRFLRLSVFVRQLLVIRPLNCLVIVININFIVIRQSLGSPTGPGQSGWVNNIVRLTGSTIGSITTGSLGPLGSTVRLPGLGLRPLAFRLSLAWSLGQLGHRLGLQYLHWVIN